MFRDVDTVGLVHGGLVRRDLKSRTNSAKEMEPRGAGQALGVGGVRGCGSCLPWGSGWGALFPGRPQGLMWTQLTGPNCAVLCQSLDASKFWSQTATALVHCFIHISVKPAEVSVYVHQRHA